MIELIFILIVAAIVMGVIQRIAPIDPTLKVIIQGLIALLVVVWVFRFLGFHVGSF